MVDKMPFLRTVSAPLSHNLRDLCMLRKGICFGVTASLVLHAVIFIFLLGNATAPQTENDAIDTFLVVPSSALEPSSALAPATLKQDLPVAKGSTGRPQMATERPLPTEQERRASVPATAKNVVPDRFPKSMVSATEPVPAAPVTTNVRNVVNEVPTAPASAATPAAKASAPAALSTAAKAVQAVPAVPAISAAQAVSATTQGLRANTGSQATGAARSGAEAIEDISMGDAGAPRYIHRQAPAYPFLARKLGKEGNVIVRLTLNERGEQKEMEVVVKAGFGFTEAAVEAVKKSRFSPATRGGKPVISRVVIPVRFVLKEN